MSSTPTLSNRLALQATGDNAGAWGTVLNEQALVLIDESLDGVTSIAVSGTVTLSSANYSTDQARKRILKFTGSGGTVIIPGVPKVYKVHNTCTASVTVKTAAGSGAIVPSASVTSIYCDGTDCAADTSLWPIADGSQIAPGLYFASDPNTGIYRVDADKMGLAAGGGKIVDISTTGVSVTGQLSNTDAVTTTKSVNAALTNTLTNNNGGASSEAYFAASNGATTSNGPGGPRLGHRGTAQTAYGALVANAAYLYANNSDLVMMADSAAGRLVFTSGGAVETGRNTTAVDGTTTWRFGRSTHSFTATAVAVSIGYLGGGSQWGIALRPTQDTTTAIRFENAAGSPVGSITQTAAATTYNTSSDYRLKDGIADLAGSGAFIDALRPREWKWTVNGSRGAGFVAHEVQSVSPSSVTGAKDAVDGAGNPVYQAMQAGSPEIIANLVAEVKALRLRVAALECR